MTYTASRRLCDDVGWVSETVTDPPNLFDATVTYLQQVNNLRAHTGLSPVESPFACTGSAHLAGEHIECTSPAHRRPVHWSTYHVLPINDKSPHVKTHMCACNPEVTEQGRIIVHNAYDKREQRDTKAVRFK